MRALRSLPFIVTSAITKPVRSFRSRCACQNSCTTSSCLRPRLNSTRGNWKDNLAPPRFCIILAFQIAPPSGRILAPFQGESMEPSRHPLLPFSLQDSRLLLSAITSSPTSSLSSATPLNLPRRTSWEEKLRAIPARQSPRLYGAPLCTSHHVGSPTTSRTPNGSPPSSKEFGLDTHIEQFDVLFPRPRNAPLKLVEGGRNSSPSFRNPLFRKTPLKSAASSSPLTTLTRSTATSPPRWSTSTTESLKTTSSSSAWEFP